MKTPSEAIRWFERSKEVVLGCSRYRIHIYFYGLTILVYMKI